jgi:hypothetical protein
MRRVIGIIAAALLLAGCTISHNSVIQSSTPQAALDLKTGTVAVYSFLDLHERQFGPTMLAAVNRQLVEKLGAAGVRAKVLSFRQSDIGRHFPAAPASTEIPVDRVIAANAGDEAATGARYRLIIFPQATQAQGFWFNYDITWELIEIKTDRTVWTVQTHGERLALWTWDEEPEGRAAKIVDSLISQMRSAGIL